MSSTKPLTGNDAVDKALKGLDEIESLPVSEQLAKLAAAQESLDKVLETRSESVNTPDLNEAG